MDTIVPYAAGADLSAKQYYAVKDDGAGAAVAISAATDKPIGILQNKPDAAGKSCTIDTDGVVRAIYGGTVAKDDLLGPDATGKLVTRTPGTDSDKWVIGRAGEAGSANDIRAVRLLPVPLRCSGDAGAVGTGAISTAELAAGAVTAAKAAAFVSAEQTGNGGAQSVAHGLGVIPSIVLVVPTLVSGGAYTATEGTHTTSNVVVTVTNGAKYKVFAWA